MRLTGRLTKLGEKNISLIMDTKNTEFTGHLLTTHRSKRSERLSMWTI